MMDPIQRAVAMPPRNSHATCCAVESLLGCTAIGSRCSGCTSRRSSRPECRPPAYRRRVLREGSTARHMPIRHQSGRSDISSDPGHTSPGSYPSLESRWAPSNSSDSADSRSLRTDTQGTTIEPRASPCWRWSGGGGGLRLGGLRRALRRNVFGNDCRIEVAHGGVRQAMPDFVHAEQRDAEIAAHRQGLAIGAQGHNGVVDFAVAWVDDLAVLVAQSLPLHAANEREAEDRRVPAVVGALGAERIGFLAGSRKHLGDRALEDAVVVDEQEPADRLAVVDLLPQAGHRALGGAGRAGGKGERREGGDERYSPLASRSENPHVIHPGMLVVGFTRSEICVPAIFAFICSGSPNALQLQAPSGVLSRQPSPSCVTPAAPDRAFKHQFNQGLQLSTKEPA